MKHTCEKRDSDNCFTRESGNIAINYFCITDIKSKIIMFYNSKQAVNSL